MNLENRIPMAEVKEKLGNLKEYMPDQEDIIYKYGKLLGEYLPDEIDPTGFLLNVEMLAYDLNAGVNWKTKERIDSSLTGQPPMMYTLLKSLTPLIADAVCPEDFAKGIRTIYEEATGQAANLV